MEINSDNDMENYLPLINILNILRTPIIINGSNIFERSFNDQGIVTHPTDKNFIKNLKEIQFNEDQKEISCGICLDSFKNGDKAFILPCKDNSHYFHIGEKENECGGILPWLKDNNTCPICRDDFPEAETKIIENTEDVENTEDTEIIENNSDINEQENPEIDFIGNNEGDLPPEDEIINIITNSLRNNINRNISNIIITQNPFMNIGMNIGMNIDGINDENDEDLELQQAIQRSIKER